MEGSIRARGVGRWEITIDLGRDSDGKRVRKFFNVKGKKADAERRKREILTALDKGIPIDTSKLKVSELLDKWFESYVQPNLRLKTIQGYESIIRYHLKPQLGDIELSKLQPIHIQAMEDDLRSRGRAPKTILNVHRTISEALNHGMKWGLIYRNPATIVDAPKQKKTEPQIPSHGEAVKILELAKETPYYPPLRFIAFTGCRRGECLGLRWRDLDFERKSVSIIQTVQAIRGIGSVIEPTKSHRGRRPIALDDETLEVLRSHRVNQLKQRLRVCADWVDKDLVFPGKIGNELHPDTLTHVAERLAKDAGTKGALHILRHFHATMLLKEGVHPKIVQERLGHANISVTLDVYSHVVPGLQEKAANAFAVAMNKAVVGD